jgi:15-cis-phytoene synthase
LRTVPQLGDLEPLYRQAALQTQAGSKSFYFATRFFPPELARAAHSVYWFCRHTDDLVDECESLDQGRRDLAEWTEALRRAESGAQVNVPVLQLFAHTARQFEIPFEYAFELIAGMRMDLDGTRYRNFEDLRLFCYRVASVVGLMMCSVIGFERRADRERAVPHAVDLGIAMQLTNILRDIGEDLGRGRVYLPGEEMAEFGYREEDLRQGVRNEAFRRLMQFQVTRARAYYGLGNAGIQLLDNRGRFAVKIASDVYCEILARVEQSDFNVFERRAVVPTGRKYWLTMRNMALPIARHSAGKMAFWKSS